MTFIGKIGSYVLKHRTAAVLTMGLGLMGCRNLGPSVGKVDATRGWKYAVAEKCGVFKKDGSGKIISDNNGQPVLDDYNIPDNSKALQMIKKANGDVNTPSLAYGEKFWEKEPEGMALFSIPDGLCAEFAGGATAGAAVVKLPAFPEVQAGQEVRVSLNFSSTTPAIISSTPGDLLVAGFNDKGFNERITDKLQIDLVGRFMTYTVPAQTKPGQYRVAIVDGDNRTFIGEQTVTAPVMAARPAAPKPAAAPVSRPKPDAKPAPTVNRSFKATEMKAPE
jgi:hypothetical protein